MSEMRQDAPDGAEHPRVRATPGTAARVAILRGTEVVAQGLSVAMYEDLVVGLQLLLNYSATDALARGHSYAAAFKDCTLRFGNDDLGAFKVIHGGFRLFKTGERTVADFALCLGPVHLEYISASAKYLRELRAHPEWLVSGGP